MLRPLFRRWLPAFLHCQSRPSLFLCAAALLCGVLGAHPAGAIGLTRTLAQLEHTGWTERDGVPDDIAALAQTADGWLWLGTSQGLWRFDGLRFARVQPPPPARFPDHDVYKLHADGDGGLWIGWRMGGISHYRHGAVRSWGTADGLPPRAIWGFAADGAGLWAAGAGGLAYFDGRRWRRIGAAQGFTAVKAAAVFVAADGTVSVFSEQGLFLRRPGATRFDAPLTGPGTRQPPQQQGNGPIWFLDQRGIRALASLERYAQPTPLLYRQPGPVSGSMLADSAGALWFEDEQGLYRNVDPLRARAPAGRVNAPGTQAFTGLTGNIVHTLMEDRERNVWIATNRGLDRFRESNVVHSPVPTNRSVRLLPAPRSGVRASDDVRSWHVANDGTVRADTAGRKGDTLLAGGGGVWYASGDGVRRHGADGRLLERFGYPPHMPAPELAYALALDSEGALWVALSGRGVLRRVGGAWQRHPGLPEAGRKTPLSLLTDSRGRTWFGYTDNQVALLEHGVVTIYGSAQGLATGSVTMLVEHGGTVWAGGKDGLARFAADRFVAVTSRPATALAGLASATGSPQGLWLNGAAGLVLLPAADLAAGGPVAARVFDEADGLRGRATQLDNGSIVRATDGRIWCATTRGLFWLDPAALHAEAVPSAPVLLRVGADGREYAVTAGEKRATDGAAGGAEDAGFAAAHLPAHPRRVTFAFAAGAPGMPARIRYRYRLAGYDHEWQHAGTATEAVYTGLPPGDFTFVAQAVNGAGAAGPVSQPFSFRVAATPLQTGWFKAACVAFGLLALGSLYRYRLRVQARRLLALEQTRHAERDRIARELHDTLLQSVQGLILRFHAATARLPQADPLRRTLEATLERADAVVVEARDRVQGLRREPGTAACLGARLQAEVTQASEDCGALHCVFAQEGEPRELPGDAEHACVRIGVEALGNASRHAAARHVAVSLHYGADALRLVVEDDGRGIDEATLHAGRPGHFGIAGMRERAAEAGGTLHIRSRVGAGTKVTFTLRYAQAAALAAMAESDKA